MNPAGDKESTFPAPAVVIVGHGTRDPAGTAELLRLVDDVRRLLPELSVEPAFLELAEPTIDQAIDRAVARGAREVRLVPLMLSAAGHVERDIPAIASAAGARHPRVAIGCTPHLGAHDQLVELSLVRFRAALAGLEPLHDERTLWVLVSRGSRVAEANAEIYRFARRRFERQPVGWMEVGFTALAEPSVPRVLEIAAQLPFERVVVQPHLLFEGVLLSRLKAEVESWRGRAPAKEWLVAGHLGCSAELAAAVAELAGVPGE